jgi:hypothetical protein
LFFRRSFCVRGVRVDRESSCSMGVRPTNDEVLLAR